MWLDMTKLAIGPIAFALTGAAGVIATYVRGAELEEGWERERGPCDKLVSRARMHTHTHI